MTTRTSRRRLCTVLVAVAAVASVSAATPAGATSTTAPSAASAAMTSLSARTAIPPGAGSTGIPLTLPTPPAAKPRVVQPAPIDTCPTVDAHLKQYAAQGVEQVACFTATGDPAQTPARAAAQAITPAAVSALCANTSGVWRIDRTTACIQNYTINGVIRLVQGGPIVGTDTFLVNHTIVLNAYNNFISENDTITLTQADGIGKAEGVNVTFTPNCTAPCQPGNGAGTTTFLLTAPGTPGSQRNWAYTFFVNPAAGTQFRNTLAYQWVFKVNDSTVPNPSGFIETMPEAARCDNQLTGKSPGCVFTSYGPVLTLPVSFYGAAAINVLAGMTKLSGTPGLTSATPLTRGDPALKDGNRDAICDDSFVPSFVLVANDSCDEFPFASSQQSGGQLKLTGKDCLEIMPRLEPEGWTIWALTPVFPGARCLRGHVPGDQNSAVGSALGGMYTTYRMLIGDPYLVAVTP